MSDERVVLLRDWSGLASWKAPETVRADTPRLWQRGAIVLHAAARLGATTESLGLGCALVVVGRSVLCGCLVVPDRLAETDLSAWGTIVEWADSHPLSTTVGERPWVVATCSAFFDPFTTVETAPWAFQPTAYSGAGFVVGADLGRTFGLCAEHWCPRRGKATGSWDLWLPGWGTERDDGWRRTSPHRPPLRVTARRVGWQMEFGPCGQIEGRPAGKRVDGTMWRGVFLDVMSLANAFDADRGASFAEHNEDFNLPPVDLPVAVTLDATGAEQLTRAVHAIHDLALTLDEEAGQWFTTPQDRREGRGRVDLVRTSSPGALAALIPARFGMRPPLENLRLDDEEHRRWAEAFHGGWCETDARLLGVAFPAVSVDVTSCYPLVAHLIGWWELMCAERIRREDATEALRQLCARAAADPTTVLEPGLWRWFGATLVEVAPDGEPFPVGIEDPRRPDGRMEVVSLFSPRRPLSYAWPDVVFAAALSGRVPRVASAVRYRPRGRQTQLRRSIPLLPGVVLHAERDPVLTLVRLRRRVKARGDLRLAADLHAVVNSLVYGNPSRFDEVQRRQGRRWVLGERPGPWNFLPLASSVAAGARLLLGVRDRQIADFGGVVAYRDTDSGLILVTSQG